MYHRSMSLFTTTLMTFMTFCTLFSFSVFADRPLRKMAKALYANRGEDVSDALAAAETYAYLYLADGASGMERLRFLVEESRARYYYGDNNAALSNEETRAIHTQGLERARLIRASFDGRDVDDLTEEEKEVFALGEYFYATHLARWAQTHDLAEVLDKVGDLQNALGFILRRLRKPEVMYFGAMRVLGRLALMNPQGRDYAQSLRFLGRAREYTSNAAGVSVYSRNTLYYAESLLAYAQELKNQGNVPEAERQQQLAKSVLQDFVDYMDNHGPEALNPDYVPELRRDYAIAKNILANL